MTDRVGTIPVAALDGEMVTAQHVGMLAAFARGENPALAPMMRRKLVNGYKLLRPVEPPRPSRPDGWRRPPAPRRHELTQLGLAVLAELDERGVLDARAIARTRALMEATP